MSESIDLSSHNDFDNFVREHGWIYDNGWSHKGEQWDSYYCTKDFEGLQLLRHATGRVMVLKIIDTASEEILFGQVATNNDFTKFLDQLKILVT